MRVAVFGCILVLATASCGSSGQSSRPKKVNEDAASSGNGTGVPDTGSPDAGSTGADDGGSDAKQTDVAETAGTDGQPDMGSTDGAPDSDVPDTGATDGDVDAIVTDVADDVGLPDDVAVPDTGPLDAGKTVDILVDAGTPDAGAPDTPDEKDAKPYDAGPPPVGKADWYKAFGGAKSEEVKGVAADSVGNVYVVGTYSSTLKIGPETFEPVEPGANTADVFVASFDPKGNFRWAHAFGAKQADIAYEVDVDGQDNVFVAGAHKADLQVGPDLLVCAGSKDLFVVTYDSEGKQLWAKSWGGKYGESPRDLSVNTSGDIFITGSYQGSITADDITAGDPNQPGLSEIFVLAIDGKTHKAMWIKTFGGQGHDVGTAIVCDQNRNAVIAVSYQYKLGVDEDAGIIFNSGGGNFNAGLVRLGQTGEVLWAKEFGGTGGEEFTGLDLDKAGNIYASGVFSDTAFFGGDELVGVSGHDIVVAGYSGGGLHLWSVGYTGEGFDQSIDLEVSGNGVYIAGRFKDDLSVGDDVLNSNAASYDIVVARFDTKDGSPVWAKAVGSAGADQGNGIGIGGDGGVFVGGLVSGAVDFAGQLTPAPGAGIDACVFRLKE